MESLGEVRHERSGGRQRFERTDTSLQSFELSRQLFELHAVAIGMGQVDRRYTVATMFGRPFIGFSSVA